MGDRVTSDEQRVGGAREDDDEREHEADDGADEAGADGQLAALEAAPRERERDAGRKEERARAMDHAVKRESVARDALIRQAPDGGIGFEHNK